MRRPSPTPRPNWVRFTIKRRLILFFLLLIFLPLLAYRLAFDLQHLLLSHQATLHQHTVQNLALILETRPELWGQTTETGQTLAHLDLDNSAIWLVNYQGQTTYVMGHLNTELKIERSFLEWIGFAGLKLVSKLTSPIPYPYPQTRYPEQAVIELALSGKTGQQYRTNDQGKAVSLMSASPLYSQNTIIGAVVFEQGLEKLFQQSLKSFYRLIGLTTLFMTLVLMGILFYAQTLSNRIIRLSEDVKNSFNDTKKLQINKLDYTETIQDEITDLRKRIIEMLEKIASYERYLKQLPRTLRHELHNPINRLNANIELLLMQMPEQPKLIQAQATLNQLKHIIDLLTEASSLEQSLTEQDLKPINCQRLIAYFQGIVDSQPPGLVVLNNHLQHNNLMISADGFLMEQLFDKLIDNALEFNDFSKPITITLSQSSTHIEFKIDNAGPKLPSGMEQEIFEGMVSVRPKHFGQATHLGLGLYLARLIADHHHAKLTAQNRDDLEGVSFKLEMALFNPTT